MYKDIKKRTNANIAMMLIIALAAVVMTACDETEKKTMLNPMKFRTEVRLGMTPVKDQGHSSKAKQGWLFWPFMSVPETGLRQRPLFAKCDVDECDELTAKFGIRNVPTILFIKNGEVVDKHVGAAPKSTFTEKIEALL